MSEDPTIVRVWRGWTTPEDAEAYERLLTEELVPEFGARVGEAFAGFELLRRDRGTDVEFMTLFRFTSWEGVKRFAGEDYETAHVPPRAAELLIDAEDHARHFESRDRRTVAREPSDDAGVE